MEAHTSATLRVMKREWQRIGERKTLYLLSIILPILLFTFFGTIYYNGVLRDIPVAVFDADNSEMSRLIIRAVESTSAFRIVEYSHSIDEIREGFQRGRIQGAFYIPEDLERNLERGKSSTVTIFNNATNLVISNTTLKDGTALIKTISGGILLKKLRSNGLQTEQAMNIINPIRIETQSLYNPNYNYLNFLVSGLIPAFLQMIIMVAAVLLISSEFTHGTFRELLATADGSMGAILLGKSIPHLAIHCATVLGILGIIFPLFGMQIVGSVFTTALLFIWFVMASFFFGLMISVIFHDQQFATEVALFLNIPAFIFSGFVFPFWAMPVFHQTFAQILPYTHFLFGFLKLYQMGAPVADVLPEFEHLSIFIIVSVTVTLFALRYHTGKIASPVSADKRSNVS
jgi:ABC-2 type transport system permease protein